MAAGAEAAPPVFLRKATGLVKGWSRFDAFVYSFLSVNLITLGFFGALSFAPYIPGGQLFPAIIITGVFVTFLVVTYAGLIAIMPRAGGDYVWQSRVIGGGIAFVLAVTGWWFILWQWAPIYGNILTVQLFQPLFAVLDLKIGFIDATWWGTNTGIFVVCLITIALAGLFVSLGMETYAKIQKVCFWIGMVGVGVMFLILLFGSQEGFQSAFNREASSLFGASGDAYSQTIRDARSFAYEPSGFAVTPILGPTLLLIPYLVFFLLWPNWGATLYGEVRGASDFRRVRNGMFWGLWGTVLMAIVFLLLVGKTIGSDFYMAANYNWANFFYVVEGAPTPAIPIWPYPALLASFYIDSTLFQVLLILVMSVWFIGWAGTLFLSSTRVIFAAAFDRVLPEWAATVSERRHVPYGAIALMLIPSIVVSAIYAYNADFRTLTLDATLVIAVTFLGTSIAATILPWLKPSMFQNSPIGRMRLGGVPVISIAGAVTTVFLGWLLVQWWINDIYGINNTDSAVFMLVLYGLALLIYGVSYFYRRAQGVNLSRIHQEIPVE
jgi:amino acid transporter